MAKMSKDLTILLVLTSFIFTKGSEALKIERNSNNGSKQEDNHGSIFETDTFETEKHDEIFQKLVEYADYEEQSTNVDVGHDDKSRIKSDGILKYSKIDILQDEEQPYLNDTEASTVFEHNRVIDEAVMPTTEKQRMDRHLENSEVLDNKINLVDMEVQDNEEIVKNVDPIISYLNDTRNRQFTQTITNQLYKRQNSYDAQSNKKLHQSSLVFVFDATGSMHDDLVQLREGAAMILQAMLERDDKSIANYVLVPYRDPEYGPVTITTNHTEFEEELENIRIYGGGDCPESSLTAITAALDASLPQSYIYVFTDATSADHIIVNSVLDLIQRKQSQIVFVLTGDCNDRGKPSYKVYEQIAIASSGQIFNLGKTDVYKVLKFVKDTLDGRRVNLGSIINEKGYNHTHKVAVDETLKQVTVSVAGRRPSIRVTNPKGHEVKGPPKVVPSLDLAQIKVINIINPEPGKWTVTVGSEDEHSVRVSGVSELNFQHGFSVQRTESMGETSHRPLQGAENYLLIDISSADDGSVHLDYAEVLSVNGTTLFEVPLSLLERRNGDVVYGTESFIPPETFFYLAINGKDKNGYVFRRIGSTAIQPQLPEKPFLTLPHQVVSRLHEDVVLTCEVESLVPVSVWWFKGNNTLVDKAASLQSAVVDHVIRDVSESDEGEYRCLARNTAGSSDAFVGVTLQGDPPLIEMTPNNVTVSPEKTIKIDCVVKSNLPLISFRMLLVHNNITEEKQTSSRNISDGVTKYSHTIDNVTTEMTRIYRCVAANRAGQVENSTQIDMLEAIKVSVNPVQMTVMLHTPVKLTCAAEGANTVNWFRGNETQISSQENNYSKGTVRATNMLLNDVTYADDGVWLCKAGRFNEIVTARSIVTVVSKPIITMDTQKNVTVQIGSELNVACRVEGKPKPYITWEDGQGKVISTKVIQPVDNSHQYISTLHIPNLGIDDGGKYTCKAKNEFGDVADYFIVLPRAKQLVLEKPEDISIEIYTTGDLVCNITSYPISTIVWQHNGTELAGETGTLLRIRADTLSAAGKYTCVARNEYEMSRFVANVRIVGLEYPVISGDNSSVTVNEGGSLELSCGLQQGKPHPTLRWQFQADNRKTVDITNLTVDNASSLVIRPVRSDHEGRYTCVAENTLGTDVRHIIVDVLFSPVFVDPTVDTAVGVTSGEKVELHCNVTGKPKPLTVWHKDGMPISFDDIIYISDQGSLVVSASRPRDAGRYRCQATNVLGEVLRTHTLHVWVPPTLEEWSHDPVVQVVEGQIVVLPCSGRGLPTPTTQWTHNNRSVLNDDEKLDGNTLRFVANVTDSGTYRCSASNKVGNVFREFQLMVFIPPSMNYPDDELFKVKLGNNVSLNCDASGYPKPYVKWHHDGQVLDRNKTDVSFTETHVLEITNASRTNVGWYTCNAENKVGFAQKKFHIILNEKPMIASEDIPTDMELISGDSLELPCRVTGNPQPGIVWMKDDQHIVQGTHFRVDINGTLNIMLATVSSNGNYTCHANNTEGHQHKTYTVQVLSPPSLNQAGQYQNEIIAVEGESVILHCPLWEADKLTVKWYKDEKLINDNTHTLVLSNASRHDQSLYSCIGSNRAGQVEASLSLIVNWPPKLTYKSTPDPLYSLTPETPLVPLITQVSSIEGADVMLDCISDANPEAETQWLKGSQMLHDTAAVLEMKNAKVYQSGNYTCLAKNALGSDTRYFNVNILVLPVIKGSENVNVTLRVGDTAMLECDTEGFPIPTVTWSYRNTDWYMDGSNLVCGNITYQSGGRFRCVASNAVGSAEKIYRVDIISKPVIKDMLLYQGADEPIPVSDNISIEVNKTISISCSAKGLPLPEVYWTHNGESFRSNVSRMGHANMTLKGLEMYLGGKYTCVAHNDAGLDGQDIRLNVLVPPKINVLMKNDFTLHKALEYNTSKVIHVVQGEPLRLPCRAEGSPTPTLSWYKDGHPFNTSDPDVVIERMGGLLVISETKIEDSANYTCVATNSVGADNGTHIVKIFSPPRTTSESNPTTYLTSVQGHDVYMECPISADPAPQIRWFKHPYTHIRTGYKTRFYLYENNTLVVRNVTLADEGKYSCIGTNQVGVSELSYELEVFAPATIRPRVLDKGDVWKHERQDLVVVNVRRGFSLFCDAFGYPEPMVAWLKDGVPLYGSNGTLFLSMDGRHLTVTDALPSDAATYTCVTRNRVGNDYKEYTVTVLVPAVWGGWSDWSACSVSCGRGLSTRRRRCHYPADATPRRRDGGSNDIVDAVEKADKMECQGSNVEQRACRIMPCQQDVLPHKTFLQSPKHMEPVRSFINPESLKNIRTPDDDYEYIKGEDVDSDLENSDEKGLWEVEVSVAGTVPENQGRGSMVYIVGNNSQSDGKINKKTAPVLRERKKQDGCPLGYQKDTTTGRCEDINECLLEVNGCHLTQMCENLAGDYRCLCQYGYSSAGRGQRCLDINECILDIHDCSHKCINVPGSYRCACPDHLVLTDDGLNCVQLSL